MRVMVAGAGGFIGGHLVKRLLEQGHDVRATDIKPRSDWWQWHSKAHNWPGCDLSRRQEAFDACDNMDQVFNLACNMGGIGFIENNKADCMVSVLINTQLLMGAKAWDAKYFFASSACVYHADLQSITANVRLREANAYYNGGAMPEDGYGWEKLFSERMCRHFHEDYQLETRVARFHNIYGPNGSWCDGREKAPAAICRKIAEAKHSNEESPIIDVWGNGRIVRSFCWIGDCIDGILKLMQQDYTDPVNIGSSQGVTIDGLIDTVESLAGVAYNRRYDVTKPKGVNGRNSDNTLCKEVLGWEPTTPLRVGIKKTYDWVEERVNEQVS